MDDDPTTPRTTAMTIPTPTDDRRARIEDFAARWSYDMSYQRELLEAAPDAFDAFAGGLLISAHRRALPADAHFVARVVLMQAEECASCVRLNLRMALEAGVDRELLRAALERPDELPDALRDVREHVLDVVAGPTTAERPDPGRVARLWMAYGREGLAELAVVLAGCRLFTTVKRALGKAPAGAVAVDDL
jgi:hypothetical protein